MKPYAIGKRGGFLVTPRYQLPVLGAPQPSAELGDRKSREPAR
jgi:hypothetical protein